MITHGNLSNGVVVHEEMLANEEKAYIFDHVINVKRESKRPSEKQNSLQQIMENTGKFPFHMYGWEELEGVLSGLGRIWSFDIWFIYESQAKLSQLFRNS